MEKYRIVNNISLNQDSTLLCVSSNLGLLVYDYRTMTVKYSYEDKEECMKNVKKTSAYFNTNIYAMISMIAYDDIKTNAVYIFDGDKNKIVNSATINSTVTNIDYVLDGIMFCGYDEIYICETDSLKTMKIIKTSSNVGDCTSLLFNKDDCLLAYRHNNSDIICVMDIQAKMHDRHFQPYNDNLPVSYIKITHDVRLL